MKPAPRLGAARGAATAGAAALLLAACTQAAPDAPLNGYLEADLLYVAPRQAGVLKTAGVQRGDRVVRGQALFALDTEPDALGIESAAARRDAAQAAEADLRKGKRPLELQSLDAQLAQARAALAESNSALQRQRELVRQGYLSGIQLDELVAARERDAAQVRNLEAQRKLGNEPARRDAIESAAAQTRAAAAELALARWNEQQASRTAPADAVVYDVLYQSGEWVGAGTPVVALLPADALKLRFFVPETLLARATVGRELAVSCDSCPADLAARIRWVSPQAEYTPPLIYSNSNRAKLVFMVEAAPLGATASLKPGQPVDVRFR